MDKEKISYEYFAKLDIRLGTIISAEKVPETDKLLKLSVDSGEEKPRTIVAGVAQYVDDLETLIGKQVPIVANLEPRILRGIESQGMILAATDKETLALLHPSKQLMNGSKVR